MLQLFRKLSTFKSSNAVSSCSPLAKMDTQTFLNTIKRGCETLYTKLGSPTMQELKAMRGKELEAKGIPCKQRKFLRMWIEKWSQGIQPYYIRGTQKHKAKAKRKLAAGVKKR